MNNKSELRSGVSPRVKSSMFWLEPGNYPAPIMNLPRQLPQTTTSVIFILCACPQILLCSEHQKSSELSIWFITTFKALRNHQLPAESPESAFAVTPERHDADAHGHAGIEFRSHPWLQSFRVWIFSEQKIEEDFVSFQTIWDMNEPQTDVFSGYWSSLLSQTI